MLKSINTLLCLQHNSYSNFLDIFTRKSDVLIEYCDVLILEKTIRKYDSSTLCLIFIDYLFMDKLSEETRSILNLSNFIFIVLVKDNNINIISEAFVYDILPCEHDYQISNFLLRLESDLQYRLDYHFLQKKYKKFVDVSMQLTTERSITNLLNLIIDSSMDLTYAEAGTIYIVVDRATEEWSYYENHSEEKFLKFVLAKNKVLPVNLEQKLVSISKFSIFGCTILSGESIKIDDVYNIPEGALYKFNSSFDDSTGYKTKSMLNVPLKDHHGRILGVLQLINKKNLGVSIPFDDTDELMTSSLAGLAAVAIENAILYKTNERLLESKTLKLQNTVEELNSAQIQLIQKEKMAAIGQLAAGVAHEINNPLGFIISNHNTIQKYVEKLIDLINKYKQHSILSDLSSIAEYENKNKIEFVKADISELHKESSEGLNRIGTIVNALRTFSHVDQVDSFQEYDINQCIHDTLIICSSDIKYLNINIEKQLSDLPQIRCNGGNINQVILNLLINAVDAILMKNPEGVGTLTIRTYAVDNYVCVDIEDDGIGMPTEIQSKIFEPFYTTKPIGTGTGIGLSICYDIVVKLHNGDIVVQSIPGIGSKFTIKLPK